jgi:putative hydrolase
MSPDGNLDLPDNELKKLDVVIASIHKPAYTPESSEELTKAWLNVIENPYVDILGHMGRESAMFDIEKVIKKAKEHEKLIEINSHSFDFSDLYKTNCFKIINECQKNNLPIVVNSDSHICYDVGNFYNSLKLIAEVNYNPKLIMNSSLGKILDYFGKYKNIII